MHKNNKDDELKNSIKNILEEQDLRVHQRLVTELSTELKISILDCAAALSILSQSNKPQHTLNAENQAELNVNHPNLPRHKSVRYRLDVGKKHEISVDEIKSTLIEVSGVDQMCISRIDIRNFYTIVDLPEGMPADIFQLLAETKIKKQKLNIKRIKYQRRFHRRSHRTQR